MVLLECHVTVRFDASEGYTVAVRSLVSPLGIFISSAPIVIPVTGIYTVKSQVAVNQPSTVVAVTVQLPAPTAVTTPVDETLATLSSLLSHITSRFVAFVGSTFAIRLFCLPRAIVTLVVLSLMPVTG